MERVFESGLEEGGGMGRNVTLALSQFSQGGGFLSWIILVSSPLPVYHLLFLSFLSHGLFLSTGYM